MRIARKQNASDVFRRLGEAEARVHGVPVEKVHFHEVGAVDSIADIVGACVALDLLDIGEIHTSAINVGSGTVKTEHGVLPVPAPATAALLEGKPIYSRGPAVELTTPTGAALAATLSSGFGPLPAMRIGSIGHGAGDRDFKNQPNVLRVLVGERTSAPKPRWSALSKPTSTIPARRCWATRLNACWMRERWTRPFRPFR